MRILKCPKGLPCHECDVSNLFEIWVTVTSHLHVAMTTALDISSTHNFLMDLLNINAVRINTLVHLAQ